MSPSSLAAGTGGGFGLHQTGTKGFSPAGFLARHLAFSSSSGSCSAKAGATGSRYPTQFLVTRLAWRAAIAHLGPPRHPVPLRDRRSTPAHGGARNRTGREHSRLPRRCSITDSKLLSVDIATGAVSTSRSVTAGTLYRRRRGLRPGRLRRLVRAAGAGAPHRAPVHRHVHFYDHTRERSPPGAPICPSERPESSTTPNMGDGFYARFDGSSDSGTKTGVA